MFLVLGLGSNLNNRRQNLIDAVIELNSSFGHFIELSDVYESEPYGPVAQSHFLNLVVVYKVNNDIEPQRILDQCLAIEEKLGRKREIKWGPRTIDIDLLFLDDLYLHGPTLTLPHPQINKRSFVIFPLRQLVIFNRLKRFFTFNESFTTKSINIGPLLVSNIDK